MDWPLNYLQKTFNKTEYLVKFALPLNKRGKWLRKEKEIESR